MVNLKSLLLWTTLVEGWPLDHILRWRCVDISMVRRIAKDDDNAGKTLFIVQQFERRGRKLTAAQSVEYWTAQRMPVMRGLMHVVWTPPTENILYAAMD